MRNLHFFFFFLLSMLSTRLTAQEATFQTFLFFDLNSNALGMESKKTLDSVATILGSSGMYEVELRAHTDGQGDKKYNERLSARREKSVVDYLVQKGIESVLITSSHHGEEIPFREDAQTEDIPENRRVEVRVTYTVFNNATDVLQTIGIQSKQTFEFSDEGVQEVKGEKGTQLAIPVDAFQTKDGVPVPNSEVTFVLEEFPGIGEAVAHQLSTLSDGKILESGGMFRMEAYYKGESLDLREGKEIDVQMPSGNMQPGMSVFVGNRNEQGIVEWEDTKTPFRTIDTSAKPKLPLPEFSTFIRSQRVPLPEKPVYTPLNFSMNVPVKPTAPGIPHQPSVPVAPAKPAKERGGVAALFDTEWRAYKKADKRYRESLRTYSTRMEQYGKSMARYETYYAQYRSDSVQYLADSTQWKQVLADMTNERMELLKSFDTYFDIQRLNGALNSMARRMDDSVYYSSWLMGDLNRATNGQLQNESYQSLKNIYEDIKLLSTLNSEAFPWYKKYVCKGNAVDYKVYRRNVQNKKLQVDHFLFGASFNLIRENGFYREMVLDTVVTRQLQAMEQQIRDRKKELGIFDRSDAGNMYQARLSRMGFINCDRFADYKPEQMARLEVVVPPGTQVFVVISRMNSLIPLYTGHDSTSAVSLPVGEEIKVVSVGAYNGKPTYDYQKLRLNATKNNVVLEPKLVTLKTLEEQLDGL